MKIQAADIVQGLRYLLCKLRFDFPAPYDPTSTSGSYPPAVQDRARNSLLSTTRCDPQYKTKQFKISPLPERRCTQFRLGWLCSAPLCGHRFDSLPSSSFLPSLLPWALMAHVTRQGYVGLVPVKVNGRCQVSTYATEGPKQMTSHRQECLSQ